MGHKKNPGTFSFSENVAKRFYKNEDGTHPSKNDLDANATVADVDIVSLDDFADRHGWFNADNPTQISFFKLDVEGYEPRIIDGSKKLFKSRMIEYFATEFKTSLPAEDKRNMLDIVYNAG